MILYSISTAYNRGILSLFLGLSLCCAGCDEIWNDPNPANQTNEVIMYTDFSERPKFLDPAKSYAAAESRFIGQIYEPPLQYHYLLRPYQLEPLLATQMPSMSYYDAHNVLLAENAEPTQIAYTVYEITIKPGVLYQNHPAFSKNAQGEFLYHQLSQQQLHHVQEINDFPIQQTREVTADDFAYQIKRLAQPALNSPILGLMSKHIVGLDEFSQILFADFNHLPEKMREMGYMDLRPYTFPGVEVVDKYTYRIKVIGKYPQFPYWLAMNFFAPMPWEAEQFYAQEGLIKKNIILDWYPVGTGPYVLAVNNPNRQMVLARNPNFRAEYYPTEGMPEDVDVGLLAPAGKRLPFLDKIVFNLEKESIPRWTKFLQGYYDLSSVGSDNFQQAMVINNNSASLAPELKNKGIKVYSTISESIFYWGFNMLDPVVGGYEDKNRALRQALAIAMDTEEFIAIFLNEQGIAAQGPIPPGIEGYQSGKEGVNPYVYTWKDNQPLRLPLEHARELLAQAGYPDGRDAQTGEQLVLHYDVITTGDPVEKARFAWMQKQLNKLNIDLNIRATDTNRFREKMSTGYAQIFSWGWSADYPDPENFLFLLYGPNSRVGTEGVNSANYQNPVYDKLYEQLQNLDAGPQKDQIITQMLAIIRADSPWVWGFYPQAYSLAQVWNGALKPNEVASNTYKYYTIDAQTRATLRKQWNRPILWPLLLAVLGMLLLCLPMAVVYWRKNKQVHHLRVKEE